MKVFTLIGTFIASYVCIEQVSAQGAAASARRPGEDKDSDAMNDVLMGMSGLKEVASNPKMLAQLMEDLQNPELMAEAAKMRNSPEFQSAMKKMTGDSNYKKAMKETAEAMKDPNTAARLQAQAEHMLERGQNEVKKDAKNEMAAAMEALYTNPDVMKEAQKIAKDPEFAKYLQQMTKDPAFKNYANAMKEMMEDPATRKRIESMSDSFKASL